MSIFCKFVLVFSTIFEISSNNSIMKTIHFIYLFSLILLLGCSEDLIDGNEKGTLYGTVRLELTHEPLVNVKITTTPSTLTVYSDEDGNFEILEAIPKIGRAS